jgi:hypothetical protein
MGGSLADHQILLGCTHINAGDSLGAVHSWESVLRLIFCVIKHDVVTGRVNQPVVL